MKRLRIIVYLLINFFSVSCLQPSTEALTNSLGRIDISPSDKSMLFSYFHNDLSSIYQCDITGQNVFPLLYSQDSSYVNAQYSPSGNEVVYIGYKKGELNSSLNIFNLINRKASCLIKGKGIITEGIFSPDGKAIFYCMANDYEKYSQLGIKDTHGYDIYKYEILNNKNTKYSNLNSYKMGSISCIDNSRILFYSYSDSDQGIFLIDSLGDVTKFISGKISGRNADLFSDPVYSNRFDKIVFTAPYQLYIMDNKTKAARLLSTSNSNLNNLRFFHFDERIMFSEENTNKIILRTIDFFGKESEPILINIPKKINSLRALRILSALCGKQNYF